MEYPVWQLGWSGGGFLMASIAVFHVFIAHIAVGGGLFLVLTERKARRENSKAILAYVKKHTRFFLLVSLVLGGITGVGIWFIIALLNPAATSALIHLFVFAWGTEWVFFLGEIVAILIYYYKFNTMPAKDHEIIGWLYFIFAWLSLFVINGVIGFMLTPGGWLESGDFWQGFFNPSFWPSLFFRTFMALTLAGLFAFFTAARIKPEPDGEDVRERMIRYACIWTAVPVALMLASGWWYLSAMPGPQHTMVADISTEIPLYTKAFLWLSPIIILAALGFTYMTPRWAIKPVTYALLALGLLYMGSFEFTREAARRPYIIHGYLYTTSIKPSQTEAIRRTGLLTAARWTRNKILTPENKLDAGREIFNLQCLPCHSVGGPMLNILPRTAKFTEYGMSAQLDGQGKLRTYMLPFAGNVAERNALAAYIVRGLHGKEASTESFQPPQLSVDIPPFDKDKDEYVLLAWNNLGMHCISDSDAYWTLLPPANDLFAQLVRRGTRPQVVTEGVKLTYKVQPGFENPSDHVRLWEFSESLFGKKLPKNTGVSGSPLAGEMHLKKELAAFEAGLVPVVPYPDDGSYNPYPLFSIEARDEKTGVVLAATTMVAPTSTEMGCRNCHGGEWRVPEGKGVAGFTDETSADILVMHDKLSGTNLLEEAKAGKPKLCQSCHADPVLGTTGDPKLLNFPAAIHGFHANYLTERGPEACAKCHPDDPAGPTQCLRGTHDTKGLDCTSCHGYLEDHALSLLKKEHLAGKKGAARLMEHLEPRTVASLEEVVPRTPWLMEPDCASCHDFEKKPDKTASAFNKWTNGKPGSLFRLRHDDIGAMMCEACHGSTHANYPAVNKYGKDRDNIPPLQYQKLAGPIGAKGNCGVCHKVDMEGWAHHPVVATE